MSGSNIRRASLAEIRDMDRRGELHYDPNAPEGPSLGPDFWANAEIVEPDGTTSVQLQLDAEVLDYFKQGGKGHLGRMQNVLKAYVDAMRKAG